MPDSNTTRQKKLPLLVAVAVIGFFFLLRERFPFTLYYLERQIPFSFWRDKDEIEGLLSSGDKARIREAVRKAVVNYNPVAEDRIVQEILSGTELPGINTALLRTALDPLWSDAFSVSDRRAAFLLASAPLVPESLSQMPSLTDLHPGVLLAIASGMSFDNPSAQLKGIPISKLFDLPYPISDTFRKLSETGVKNLGDPKALALVSILVRTREAHAVETLFGEAADMREVLARLSLLLPFFADSEKLADIVYSYLRDTGGLSGQALSWFEIEPAAGWAKVSAPEKLRILFGTFPKTPLSFEQLGDLMMFPLPTIRLEAKKKLTDKFLGKSREAELEYLISDQNRLSRTQNILLLATLFAKPAVEAEFVVKWFELNPPPLTVLGLLLARQKYPENDRFNFEAARYLKRTVWAADLPILSMLVQHPEPLARSIGYARLDPNKEEERALLQTRLNQEKEKNLEQELIRRLNR